MGLDMVLNAQRMLTQKEKDFVGVSDVGAVVEYEVMYWRKANQIHKWFVDNVQDGEDDCGRYLVSKTQLTELIKLCERVLENRSEAKELLPCTTGASSVGKTMTDITSSRLKKQKPS